ncbi:MAG: glycosyltransferase family 2 protein, partial [Chthoniobacteraceae bacterium]
MKIIVIVLNWNGKEDTLRCLSSLCAVTTPHSVVVVDNGSTDDSVQAISQNFPNVHLISTGVNLGYAEGNNMGLHHALEQSPDAILVLNNDTTVEPDILAAFLIRDLPIQGARQHLMEDPTRLGQLGGRWNSQTGMFDAVGINEPARLWTEPLNLDYVSGCALFVKAEVFRRVGLFDARFFL